jgi:heme/copper-type cytochrome/quinol oxidase subunit 2
MEGWQDVVVFAVVFGIVFGFVWSFMRRRFKDRS